MAIGPQALARRRVLLNAAPLEKILTGIGRYTRSLYSAVFAENLADVAYFYKGSVRHVMPQQGMRTVAVAKYMPIFAATIIRKALVPLNEWLLAKASTDYGPDIYHETGLFPQHCPGPVKTVFNIYDLSLIRLKRCHPPDRVRHFENYFFQRLERADHIITISEFVKEEIREVLGIGPEHISVTPLAADSLFSRRLEHNVRRYLRSKRLPQRYLLHVGAIEPRKNLVQLVRAVGRMENDIPLVCAGWSGWLSRDLDEKISRLGLQNKIIRLGYVSDEELALLYSGATAFVYPSIYEGFGLPVLEAMSCGCPVACSDRASLPEVAGDAAILFDPDDHIEMAASLDEIVENEATRELLIARGYKRSRQFSWRATALKTAEVFNSLYSA